MIKRKHGGIKNKRLIDFSSPTNPLGPPIFTEKLLKKCINQKHYRYYPSYKKLIAMLSEYWNIDEDYIIPVNGSDEALTITPLALKLKKLIILEPNFGDYDLMSNNLKIKLIRPTIDLRKEDPSVDIDKLINILNRNKDFPLLISRPNNPTGFCIEKNELEYLSSRINNMIIIDEAFVELSDCERIRPSENYVIIRSQTKTFSTPGLRLGEIITLNRKLLTVLESSLQAWPIDSITNCFYSNLFYEKEFIKNYLNDANNLIAKEKEFIMRELKKIIKYKSRTSFILIKHKNIPNPYFKKELIKKGLFIRDASSFYGLDNSFSRISIKNHEENLILINAINGVLNEQENS
ncbi:MAG: aminotransferase class I/II-fold pyridoxal phosphate-dependent enzyme [Caldisphaera sp.]|uniref:aminotransferase class I/II-fold pyridoxal phosphate-dependent enzyme n=1 Tax=Caldisphaera sp. TaxID=2060322 RepID=UPI003D13B935